jgi:voltage-gated potassium channel
MAKGMIVAFRQKLNAFFDDDAPQTRSTRTFNFLLSLLIIANVAAVISETVNSLSLRYDGAFRTIETVATSLFVLEYALRAWTAVDRVKGQYRRPLWGRIRYLCSFFALIDLIAILPALLGLLGATDLRVLRLLRLLRTIKLTRHSTIFSLIWIVLRKEIHAIGAIVLVLCLMLTLSGSLMYVVEGQAQPNVFNSIPASMWWAVETVTTVGYGDMVPVTVTGRILGSVISVTGIITFATFSGLITVGLMDELRMHRTRHSHFVVHQTDVQGSIEKNRRKAARSEDQLFHYDEDVHETIKTFLQ